MTFDMHKNCKALRAAYSTKHYDIEGGSSPKYTAHLYPRDALPFSPNHLDRLHRFRLQRLACWFDSIAMLPSTPLWERLCSSNMVFTYPTVGNNYVIPGTIRRNRTFQLCAHALMVVEVVEKVLVRDCFHSPNERGKRFRNSAEGCIQKDLSFRIVARAGTGISSIIFRA